MAVIVGAVGKLDKLKYFLFSGVGQKTAGMGEGM